MLIVLFITYTLLCEAKGDFIKTTTMSSGHNLSLRNLCPYRKFCQSGPLKEIKDDNYESCCEDCSCDNDCFETGSCCPDMPLSGLDEPTYPCRNVGHFAKGVDVTFYNPYGWFHIIDGCPGTTNVISYQRCYTPVKVIDYEIVIDALTRKVYRNKHCAECNGVWNYDKLDLRMSCKDPFFISTLPTTEEREQYIMANCSLMTLIRERHFGLSQCFPESLVTTVCNSTGYWVTYNKEIEEGCNSKSYDQNKIFKRLSNIQPYSYDYYANVYCFLCNVDSRTVKSDTCEIFKDVPDSKTYRVSFQVILSTKIFEVYSAEVEDARCTNTQMWDPYTGVCRNLLCPSGHIPDNTICKGLFSNLVGYTVSTNFKVTIEYGNINSDNVLLRILGNRLMRELGTDITCGVCSATLFAGRNSNSQLFLRNEMYAKEGCLYSTLLERIRKIAIHKEMYLQFKYMNQVIRVMMTLVFEQIDDRTGYKALAESQEASCNAVTMIDETILLYCPSFMFSREELEDIGLINECVYSVSNNKTSAMHQVCVETYFAAKQATSTAAVLYLGNIFKIYTMISTFFFIKYD